MATPIAEPIPAKNTAIPAPNNAIVNPSILYPLKSASGGHSNQNLNFKLKNDNPKTNSKLNTHLPLDKQGTQRIKHALSLCSPLTSFFNLFDLVSILFCFHFYIRLNALRGSFHT